MGPLSQAARTLLSRRLLGDEPVNDRNRAAYHELVAAGIMMPMGSFTKGDEATFWFTDWGWQRRLKLVETGCAKELHDRPG